MFIDSSAIVAILNEEPGAHDIERRLEAHEGGLYCSSLVRFEASLSLSRAIADKRKQMRTAAIIDQAHELVDEFLNQCEAQIISIDDDIGHGAIEVAKIYGKAVGHPADLNFGDCFSYACAKAYRLGLLYKGADFAVTDLA